MKIKKNFLPDEVKLQAIEEYMTTDISREQLKEKYGFAGNNNISKWMRKFDIVKPDDGEIKLLQTMAKESQKTPREIELEEKIRKLEKDLAYANLRNHALDTMINIAERELKISIRKKPGPKQ
jgi:transposase-like protein